MKLTITEALAEIKTIGKRLEKKYEFVGQYAARNEQIRDPLEKDGGSKLVLERELQSIGDLESRIVAIRKAIQEANLRIEVTVQGETSTIAEWLTWRREVAPKQQQFITALRGGLLRLRQDSQRKGIQVNAVSAAIGPVSPDAPQQITVNVDEMALAARAEQIEAILGALDGLLSLKNATEMIELPD